MRVDHAVSRRYLLVGIAEDGIVGLDDNIATDASPYTSQIDNACRSPSIALRVGMNSCATYPR